MENEDIEFGYPEAEYGEGQYPELQWLKDDEVFVEKVHIVKGVERHKLMIKQTIKRTEVEAVTKVLKHEHDADDIYLTTIEK